MNPIGFSSFQSPIKPAEKPKNPVRKQLDAILAGKGTRLQQNNALFDLACELFSGYKKAILEDDAHLSLLQILFRKHLIHSTQVDPSLVAKIIEKAANKEKPEFMKMPSTENSKDLQHFHEDSKKIVTISFGGGRRFIDSFLSKEKEGYAIENNGRGIFVSVNDHRSDAFYSTRSPILFFDRPAVMRAEVPTSSLHKINTHPDGVILNKEYLGDLKNVEVKDLPNKYLINIVLHLPDDIEKQLQELGEDFTDEEKSTLCNCFEDLEKLIYDLSSKHIQPERDVKFPTIPPNFDHHHSKGTDKKRLPRFKALTN